MTQVLIDRATLEQLVAALNEVDQHVDLKRYDTAPNEVLFDVVMEAMVKGRAALANAEPTVVSADEELMRGILERMERYQTKRGDYETFEEQAAALRKRLEKHQ